MSYHPTLDQLRAHMDAYGPEGIEESAQHLSEEERETLALDVKRARARKAQRFPKRRKRQGPAMSPYIDKPTIPEGMTVQQYRELRFPRNMPLWKHALWVLGHHMHTR